MDAALQARVADLESQVTAAAEEVKASRETVVQSLREQAQKAANDFKDDVMAYVAVWARGSPCGGVRCGCRH